jgi:predicted nucleic acid-binding protein
LALEPCLLDASLILTVSGGASFDLLWLNRRYEWLITPLVRRELKRQESRDPIEKAILSGRLRVVELDTTQPRDMATWVQWTSWVDAGEAEAIALAIVRGWRIAIEDRQAQRMLDRRVEPGRWINTTNLLVDAVHDKRLTVATADQVFRGLDCYPGYVKRGVSSIASLV